MRFFGGFLGQDPNDYEVGRAAVWSMRGWFRSEAQQDESGRTNDVQGDEDYPATMSSGLPSGGYLRRSTLVSSLLSVAVSHDNEFY